MSTATRVGLHYSAVDLSGVPVWSRRSIERPWRHRTIRCGLDRGEVLRLWRGRCSVETIAKVAPHLDTWTEAERLEREQAADAADLSVYPGEDRLIAEVLGPCWGVVTSGTRELKSSRLGSLPTPLVTVESIRIGNPAPEGYLSALVRLAAPPNLGLVVEDSRPRSSPPSGGHVHGRYGRRGFGAVEEADLVVETLAELRSTVFRRLMRLQRFGGMASG